MLSTSLKAPDAVFAIPMRWIPAEPTLANYVKAVTQVDLLRGTWNTLLIAVPSTVGGLLTAAFAGYAFAKMKFPFREPLFAALMASMMLPGIVTLLPQFFLTIPDELIEAATLDGCNPFQTFTTIIFPFAGPALATLAIFGFKGAWNDYFGPLIYVSSPEKFTLQQMIASTQNAYGGEPAVLMAASLLALLPLLILFFCAQKYFVEGIASSGMKN